MPSQQTGRRALAGTISLHVSLILGAVACIVILSIVVPGTNDDDHERVVCYADGSAHVLGGFPWPGTIPEALVPAQFLSITDGFGNFTFAQAKTIDVAWDTIVGRGGQAALGIMVYPVMRRALRLCMERRSVSLDLFSGLAFSGLSAKSLKPLLSRKRIIGRTRTKEALLENIMIRWVQFSMIMVTCYVLAFSTFVSAMTGYSTTFEPYVTNPNNTDSLVDVAALELPPVVIVDGWRVNLTSEYPIYQESADFATLIGYYVNMSNIGRLNSVYYTEPCLPPECTQASNKSLRVIDHETYSIEFFMSPRRDEFYGISSNNIRLSGKSYSLSARALEIVPVNDCQLPPSVGPSWFDVLGYSLDTSAYNPYIGTTRVLLHGTKSHFVCQPTTTYKWGFSNAMLLTFCCASWLFIVIAVSLHWIGYDESRIQGQHDSDNFYRDALDLAAELKTQVGEGVHGMLASELKQRVGRPRIYMELNVDGCGLSRKELRQERQRKWRQDFSWKQLLRNFWPALRRRRKDAEQKNAAGTRNPLSTQEYMILRKGESNSPHEAFARREAASDS